MNVNGEKYSVYPDYMQLLKKNPLDSHTDIYAPVNVSNSKKLVLSQFFDVLQKNQNEQTFKNEKDFNETISKALKEYKTSVIDQGALTDINEKYLDDLKLELASCIATYQGFEEVAEKKAKNKVRLAFLTCLG
jgi:glycosylphosphatidylinositol transamidase (GPIT) subunit GPI8